MSPLPLAVAAMAVETHQPMRIAYGYSSSV